MKKTSTKAPRREGHDRWGMAGKKAGAHVPRSEKRRQQRLAKAIKEAMD